MRLTTAFISGLSFFAGCFLSYMISFDHGSKSHQVRNKQTRSRDEAMSPLKLPTAHYSSQRQASQNLSASPFDPRKSWKSELLTSFCKQRTRKAVKHDTSRYTAQAEELLKRIASTWKKFEPACTGEFASLQENHFRHKMLHGQIPLEGPIGCQECDDLLDLLHLLSPSPNKIFVEVGANKGYDMVALYKRWTNFTTNLVWLRTGLPPGCPYYADVDRHVFPRVIAVEPSPSTHAALVALAGDLPLCNLELHRLAIAAAPGRAIFRAHARGAENAHLVSRGKAHVVADPAAGDVEVEVDSLDGFLERTGAAHVDFLAIDTEGFDAAVLKGAGAALTAGRVDLLTFEFASTWPPENTLRDVVDDLGGRGYDCYYVGFRVLIRLSGPGCWRDVYGDKPMFANILCARRAFALGEVLLAPFNLANERRFSPEVLAAGLM